MPTAVRIRLGELSQPPGLMRIIISGLPGVVTGTEPTVALEPGVYFVESGGRQGRYGELTVTPEGTLTAAGALDVSGSEVRFRLDQLARVKVRSRKLSAPPQLVSLAVCDVAAVADGQEMVLYLPDTFPGERYAVTTAGGQARFGSFTIRGRRISSTNGFLFGSGTSIRFRRQTLSQLRFRPKAGMAWTVPGVTAQVMPRKAILWLPPGAYQVVVQPSPEGLVPDALPAERAAARR